MRNVFPNVRLMDYPSEIRNMVHKRNQEPMLCQCIGWSMDYVGDARDDSIKLQRAAILNDLVSNALPMQQARVIRLKYWGDLDLDEICKAMDRSRKTIRQIETNALRNLRRLLNPFFDAERGA